MKGGEETQAIYIYICMNIGGYKPTEIHTLLACAYISTRY